MIFCHFFTLHAVLSRKNDFFLLAYCANFSKQTLSVLPRVDCKKSEENYELW